MIDVTIKLDPQIAAIRARLRDDRGMLRAVARAMDYQNDLTVSHIHERRMSQRGPDTLGVVTGRLRRSIRATRARVIGNAVQSSIGSNVRYMAPHEFGFDGIVNVAAYAKKEYRKMVIFGRRRKIRLADKMVKAHKKHLRIRARAPIAMGIHDRTAVYAQSFAGAIGKFYLAKDAADKAKGIE